MMDNCGVYAIYFDQHPNEFYIGRSTNLYVRIQNHKSALLANRHINKKLQNYHNKYGMPNFEILELAEPKDLKILEETYIEEFGAFSFGLNLTNGGENAGFGEGANNAKHQEQDYLKVLEYLANTELSFANISDRTGVSRDIIKHISSGAAHGYLAQRYPELYEKAIAKKYTRNNSAKAKGIKYPKIKSPMGEVFEVENIHQFCTEHKLQYQNLHKVLTKQRKSHKGWTLV